MFSIRTLTTKLRTSTVLDNRVVMMLTQQKEMKQKKRHRRKTHQRKRRQRSY